MKRTNINGFKSYLYKGFVVRHLIADKSEKWYTVFTVETAEKVDKGDRSLRTLAQVKTFIDTLQTKEK